MSPAKKPRPSELEMQALTLLWEQGPLTVRQLLERLPDGKPRAYTTVLAVMQGMTRKGLVTHTQDGPAHVYHAAVTREEALRPVMRTMLRNIFGGNPSRVLQALLDSADVTDAELREMRKLINAAAKSTREENA